MDIDADLDLVVRIPLRQKCFFMMGGASSLDTMS